MTFTILRQFNKIIRFLVAPCQLSVVYMANVGPNQSEYKKDNRVIVLEGHVSH